MLIREWQARIFTRRVPGDKKYLYRLPIALKNFALAELVQTDSTLPDVVSGVLYPSVATWLHFNNLAILPREVDNKLMLFEMVLATLDSITEDRREDGSISTKKALKPYDVARPDLAEKLKWGQKSQIFYPEGVDASQFTPLLLPPEEQ